MHRSPSFVTFLKLLVKRQDARHSYFANFETLILGSPGASELAISSTFAFSIQTLNLLNKLRRLAFHPVQLARIARTAVGLSFMPHAKFELLPPLL